MNATQRIENIESWSEASDLCAEWYGIEPNCVSEDIRARFISHCDNVETMFDDGEITEENAIIYVKKYSKDF